MEENKYLTKFADDTVVFEEVEKELLKIDDIDKYDIAKKSNEEIGEMVRGIVLAKEMIKAGFGRIKAYKTPTLKEKLLNIAR